MALPMTNYFDVSGKVVLITGGTRGIGYALAKGFAEQGADLVIASRKLAACETTAAELRAMGRRALPWEAHVGRWTDLDGLVEAAYREFGKVDVLINNAGMSPVVESSLNTTEELIDKVLGVNLKGPFRLSALLGDRMKRAGSGSIINITSTAAVRPLPEFGPYAAAKAGLNVLTRAHAHEFGPAVRVNAIMCGPFWTDASRSWREEADRTSDSAVRRIGRPDEVLTTALYFASAASSFTTGAVLELSGGIR
jgi:NAD(P)-dependent dehydrogenase (short-subunit alcohol dehydrogenase family)